MNRRSFIKRAGLLVATIITTPSILIHIPSTSIIPVTTSISSGKQIQIHRSLEMQKFSDKFIKPAFQTVADTMDKNMFNIYRGKHASKHRRTS